jgi:hypothetical protein
MARWPASFDSRTSVRQTTIRWSIRPRRRFYWRSRALLMSTSVSSKAKLPLVECSARPVQFCRIIYLDDKKCLLANSLPHLFVTVFPSRHLHISMLKNDYTVPTRWRHKGRIVDPHAPVPVGCSASRSAIQPNNLSLGAKYQTPVRFLSSDAPPRSGLTVGKVGATQRTLTRSITK